MLREWGRLPVGLLEEILEDRHYARVKAEYDRDPTSQPDESATRQLVRLLEFEIAQDEIDQQTREEDARALDDHDHG